MKTSSTALGLLCLNRLRVTQQAQTAWWPSIPEHSAKTNPLFELPAQAYQQPERHQAYASPQHHNSESPHIKMGHHVWCNPEAQDPSPDWLTVHQSAKSRCSEQTADEGETIYFYPTQKDSLSQKNFLTKRPHPKPAHQYINRLL